MLSSSLSPRLNARYIQLISAAAVLTVLLWFFYHAGPIAGIPNPLYNHDAPEVRPFHPIDKLIRTGEKKLELLAGRESHDVRAAGLAYQKRRGRRPPPGFDTWYKFAQDNNAVIVEDFFDRIYEDLNPFWALPPQQLREQGNNFIHRISIRNGIATQRSNEKRPWLELWQDLVGTVAQYLPDLDMAINEMDESRMIAPWETIDEHMRVERTSRKIVPEPEVIKEFGRTAVADESSVPVFDPEFASNGPYWDHAVIGCPPSSPARTTYKPETDFAQPPPIPTSRPEHSFEGYVKNWTLTKSPCDNPSLQALHGTFVEPLSISNTKKLFPLFGGSKLPMNNEILLPPAMYWTTDPFYSGGQDHGDSWESKKDKLIWRGAASGGRNKEDNWIRFQRHRFVAMMNSTSVKLAETSDHPPPNFEVPNYGAYKLLSTQVGFLGDWIGKIADAAFVHLLCFPDPSPPHCAYTDRWYKVADSMSMKKQYAYKYLPDIDGNSFSGRYRGFLGSTSLPIKATIYDEWHDSRLVPWKHFVPMDNTFMDVYGILEYFLGHDGKQTRDDIAQKIALEGKAWAEKVLRREDMQIYVFRLLLEYARLCDDNREKLGWIVPAK